MRKTTETRREGTNVGEVDWTHPDVADTAARLDLGVEFFHGLAEHPEWFEVSDYGGSPRLWRDVYCACMYDGWPYWQPRPALLTQGPLGPEWMWLKDITGIMRKARR